MMRIELASEPAEFHEHVRQPGMHFLSKCESPTTKQWAQHAYWRKASPWLRRSHKGICSYACHWISEDTGGDSIDHFVCKKLAPALAYEWANFRYVCTRMNARKGTKAILDPKDIPPEGVYEIVFPALVLRVRKDITDINLRRLAESTIEILRLNDNETCVSARMSWLRTYVTGGFQLDDLRRFAPFIASELERQNRVDTIKDDMARWL